MIGAVAGRKGAPSLPVMLVVLAVVVGGLVTAATLSDRRLGRIADGHSVGEAADLARSLEEYGDAIAPATKDAGAAIVLGIRPDIVEFRAGNLAPEVWRTDMEARARQFIRAREAFRAAPAPPELDGARQWFDEAFVTYQRAVERLLAAADASGDAREAAITEGASLGDRGDELFDRGVAELQRQRREIGLGPDRRFTDPGE